MAESPLGILRCPVRSPKVLVQQLLDSFMKLIQDGRSLAPRECFACFVARVVRASV